VKKQTKKLQSELDERHDIVYNGIAHNIKEEPHMAPNPITEDDLNELNILRRKIEVVLDCTIDDANARNQTLTYIATDYLITMGEMLQVMLQAFFTPTHV